MNKKAGRLHPRETSCIVDCAWDQKLPKLFPSAFGIAPKLEKLLASYLVQNSSKHGEIVLDNFGGSGSTLIACEQTGRVCRMMELDEHYCDVIRRRWAEFKYGEGCDWKRMTPAVTESSVETIEQM